MPRKKVRCVEKGYSPEDNFGLRNQTNSPAYSKDFRPRIDPTLIYCAPRQTQDKAMVSATKATTKTQLTLDEDLGKIYTRRHEETPLKIFLKMENTNSRRGKKLFREIPFTEFFTRHQNINTNSEPRQQRFATTTTRLSLANQMTQIADGPFFYFSFFNFFSFSILFLFNLEFSFFVFLYFFLSFLRNFYFGLLDGKLDGINFSFSFSHASRDTGDM